MQQQQVSNASQTGAETAYPLNRWTYSAYLFASGLPAQMKRRYGQMMVLLCLADLHPGNCTDELLVDIRQVAQGSGCNVSGLPTRILDPLQSDGFLQWRWGEISNLIHVHLADIRAPQVVEKIKGEINHP